MKAKKLTTFLCIIINILLLIQAGIYIMAFDVSESLRIIFSDHEIIGVQTDNMPPLQELFEIEELEPMMASWCPSDYYHPGRPSVPDNYVIDRRDELIINSDPFLDYMADIGNPTSGLKYICETWKDKDDSDNKVERHYWDNKSAGMSYYHS